MNTINIDILETIIKYLSHRDIFSINILSNDMHNMFKCIEVNDSQKWVEHVDILKKYSFKNIKIKNKEVIKCLTMENKKELKLDKIHYLNLTDTEIQDVSALGDVRIYI